MMTKRFTSIALLRICVGSAILVCLSASLQADEVESESIPIVQGQKDQIKAILKRIVDIAGAEHAPLESKSTRGVVLIFVLADCPISNSYAQEYNRLFDEYLSKGIALYLVHPDPQINRDRAARHAKEYRLKAPIVLDPKHSLVKATGVSVTPEAAVFNTRGDLVYRGRLDDRYLSLGKRSERVGSTEVRDAIKAILEDRPIVVSRAPAVGCSISDLE